MFALARELFARGSSIKFVVVGNSMYPFIRHNRDMVTLAGATFSQVKVADIVLAYREEHKAYILHRVVRKTANAFYMSGDAYMTLEGPYPAEAVIGLVTGIFRVDKNGQEKQIAGFFYRLLARLWLLVRPIRPAIFKCYFAIRRKMNG